MGKRRKSGSIDQMEDFIELQKNSLEADPFDSAFTSKGRIYPFYKGANKPFSITMILFPLAALLLLALFLELNIPFLYMAVSYSIALVIAYFLLSWLARKANSNSKHANRKG